ncbi:MULTISPECIES: substrate-binding periplasmic protein [Pseudomonas]|jgi:polar amino acid transport system substrate-binding protein|uniref:Amino acid ABC transporter substrate-binding protein, PAAT family n=3 Tax=Pseudomonas TaxID=286 RepID=A0AB37ZR41_PSESX|nr:MULTISPECIES: transporter substrate-binding domain-containing protein [Pseudomonas]ALD98752.1 amino acid ABC transporter substrate-binding protein [Pseudomonas syringae UMAF0158]KTB90522.1 amino acid ABC transporter substrate-binding protein [Pseudomonas syringae ICMP 11293]KTC02427.1 amino acid ABC transporter substrate-binding protein [Pseudomonas sp. ICMP 10191]MBI6667586.1 transporter substrate-binding domain-containing protein [Pseudomonas syringae]MBI6676380.1 transporter substrate-bi
MSQLLRAVGLLVFMLMAPANAAEKLRLVADPWPPFTDALLLNGGLATDIVNTALRRAGYTTLYEQVPWARAMLGLSQGRHDVLINAWFSEERTKIGQFSAEYLLNRVRFIKRKESPIGTLTHEQLHKYMIAVVRGYAYAPAFDNDTELQKVPVQNFSTAIRMLAAERVDLTLEDEYVARYNLAMEPDEVRDRVEFLPGSLSDNSLHILVSLKNPHHEKIVADFDREIAAMKADGTYDELLRLHGLQQSPEL